MNNETKKCPACGEAIPKGVSVCPLCNEIFDSQHDYVNGGGGEDALFRTRTHWFVFGPWLLVTVVFNAVLIFGFLWGMPVVLDYLWEMSISFSLILIFLLVFIAWAVCAFETVCRIILFITAEYAIMPDGIVWIRGRFLGKINEDINISDVVSVNLRSFNQEENYGTVVILTKDGNIHKLRKIKYPETFIDYMVKLLLSGEILP